MWGDDGALRFVGGYLTLGPELHPLHEVGGEVFEVGYTADVLAILGVVLEAGLEPV